MKTNKLVYLSFSVISLFSLCSLAFVKQKIIRVEAYTASSLPTTIDLNDSSEEEIRNYYKDIENINGNSLLIKLKKILSNGQKYYKYDGGASIWQIYEIADRDWKKSPASEITFGTYDEDTNTITDYKYGTNSDHKNDPYVHALYVNRDVDNQMKVWGNHNVGAWGLNREHVWPSSQGFDGNSGSGAMGDPMHLMAGNSRVNQTEHNNYYYGYVDKTKDYYDPYMKNKNYVNLQGNYNGYSKTVGSGIVFEPQDSDKGDIARAIFYMAARYNNLAKDDVVSVENPNLVLEQKSEKQTAYVSTDTNPGKMGVLSDLLEWNKIDPPSEYEIHRNNLLYKNFTNNRNPFIDFPEWADAIWGTSSQGVYDPTVTTYASASKDPINGAGEPGGEVKIQELFVDTESATLDINESIAITVSYLPKDADNFRLVWSSSDNAVASVTNKGVVTGLKPGKCTITVYDEVNYTSAECLITVVGAPKKPCGGNISFTSTILFITAGCGIILFFFRRKPKKQ